MKRWTNTFSSLAFATVLLFVVDAFARAGGGEHYSGGSRSSSSGGGGGGGDGAAIGYILEMLIRLTFAYPKVMIPVWIIIIGGIWLARRQQANPATHRALDELEHQRVDAQSDLSQVIERMRRRDPELHEQSLALRVEKLFLEVQEGWFRRDLNSVRRYLSDATYRRFVILQNIMTREGRRDASAEVKVLDLRLLRASSTQAFDSVTFSIKASMRDTDVDASMSDEDARRAAARVPAQRFVELWTFVRRPSAKSVPDDVWMQGGCPNCGAPFDGGESNTCAYCQAIVNSGNHDWVLTEITQMSEFVPHPPMRASFVPLLAADPNNAPEILEDRALLLFWKWVEATTFADARSLRKLSTADAFERLSQAFERSPKEQVPLLRIPAVGGADLVASEMNVDGFDRVHVDIRWSARSAGSPRSRPRRHVLIMTRKSGALTREGTGLATERCGNCSAPLTNSDSSRCDYCGHDLQSAQSEWQLAELVSHEQWRQPRGGAESSPSKIPAWASRSERVRLLQLVASVARADGVVTDEERRLLRKLSARWQVPWSEVEELLSFDVDLDSLGLNPSADAEIVLRELITMAKADGRIDRKERQLLEHTAQHLKISPSRLLELLNGR